MEAAGGYSGDGAARSFVTIGERLLSKLWRDSSGGRQNKRQWDGAERAPTSACRPRGCGLRGGGSLLTAGFLRKANAMSQQASSLH